MTAVEYAVHRKCSDSYIRRLRRNGLVIDCEHGMIDVAASDKSLNDNLHPIRGGDRTSPPADAQSSPPAAAVAADPAPPSSDQIPRGRDHLVGESLPEAVRRERLARARLAEIELGERRGDLIIKHDAQRATVTLVRQAIVRMRLMGSRLRGTLAVETDPRKIERLIDAEVDVICRDFRKAAEAVAEGQAADDSKAIA